MFLDFYRFVSSTAQTPQQTIEKLRLIISEVQLIRKVLGKAASTHLLFFKRCVFDIKALDRRIK